MPESLDSWLTRRELYNWLMSRPAPPIAISWDDITDRPTIPSIIRTTSSMSLSLSAATPANTGTQVSTTKDASVRLTYSTQFTFSLTGTPGSFVILKKCATNDTVEANWTECGRIGAELPAGWYIKAVPSGAGTHSEAFVSGEKTLYG